MFLLDVAVLVGILLTLTKVADLLLRPHQQRRLQSLFESVTLSLSYTSMFAAARRLARRHFWWLALTVALLVPLQMYLGLPLLADVFQSIPGITAEVAGLIVVIVFCGELLAAIPAAIAFRWVLRDDSGKWTAIRYGSLLIALATATEVAQFIVANDVRTPSPFMNRALGLVELLVGSLLSTLVIAAWIFAFALLAHLLLRLIEAIAWRVVEYQRGAWAAVVAIATAILGFVDLYLKNP